MPYSPNTEHSISEALDRKKLIETLESRFSRSGVLRRKHRRLSEGMAFVIWLNLLECCKRTTDLLVAGVLLVIAWPLFLALLFVAIRNGGGVRRSQCLGRWGIPFEYLSFEFKSGLDRTPLTQMPALVNLLRGDISLIGPRPVAPDAISAGERNAWRRYNVRPGLLCLWWIRQRANIAYSPETEIDSEYIDSQSLWGDFAIALRAIPAAMYGPGVATAPDRISLLGIPIDNLTMDEAIERMIRRPAGQGAAQVCFVNADCVNVAFRHNAYRNLLNHCHLVLGDGIGVKLAGKILNSNIRQNVNGTDLFPRLCEELERRQLGIFLLGGKPDVADDVARWIGRHYSSLRVCGTQHGYFSPAEEPAIVQRIAASGAQVLLVAFGAPKQDLWIQHNLARLGVPVAMGVGGLFDFYSGRIARAPVWMREVGFEWLYRFLQEPRRMWKRYFVGNAIFLFRVVRERSSAKANQQDEKRGACL
jgi:N-acetylglucosaminyldiphosphoundecaprenol N-acetyl-beta-D-mannosaminyltransferase